MSVTVMTFERRKGHVVIPVLRSPLLDIDLFLEAHRRESFLQINVIDIVRANQITS